MKSYENVNCDIRSCSQREKRKSSVAQTMEKQKETGKGMVIIEKRKEQEGHGQGERYLSPGVHRYSKTLGSLVL